MSSLSFQNSYSEILQSIFLHLDSDDIENASKVCKTWNKSIQTMFSNLCKEFSSNPTPLDQSWNKRWKVMTSYNPKYCQRKFFSLKPFFDEGLKFIAVLNLSCFKDEVILSNSAETKLYRCNFINGQKLEIPISISDANDKIEQIYCAKSRLAIRCKGRLFIYDLSKNEEISRFSFEAQLFISCFDGEHLLLETNNVQPKKIFNIKLSSLSLTARKYHRLNFPAFKFSDGKCLVEQIGKDSSFLNGLKVINLTKNETRNYYPPSENIGSRVSQFIISANLLAYAVSEKIGPMEYGRVFKLASYNQSVPVISPISTWTLPGTYEINALTASEQHLICSQELKGNNQEETSFSVAIWDFKDHFTSFPIDYKVENLVADTGRILVSKNGTDLELFDFSGMTLNVNSNSTTNYKIIKDSYNIGTIEGIKQELISFGFDIYVNHRYFGFPKIMTVAFAIFSLFPTGFNIGKRLFNGLAGRTNH